MALVIAWRTTKLIEGGHRGLQAYYDLYVITSTFFLRFLRFFFKIQKRDFLRFFAVFHTFSRTTQKMVFCATIYDERVTKKYLK